MAIAMILVWYGPIVQPSHYHEFADQRSWLNIPHFMDVVSNLPFLLVGVWGFHVAPNKSSRAWQVFFISVALTCFGSSFYHWAPDDFGLLINRLPIAWACASLSCALLAERVDARFASTKTQLVALLFATLSVLYWYATQHFTQGKGDLRPYLLVQFAPMLLVPLCVFLAQASGPSLINGKDWAIVLGLYALAKVLEIADHQLFNLLGFISGHTLKHLLAALAAGYLAHRLSVTRTKLRFAD
jgi:hypothetical protein